MPFARLAEFPTLPFIDFVSMKKMSRRPFILFVLWAALSACSEGGAQNVSGYDAMADPYLFLLREPAVIADLALSETQRRELRQLNAEIDGPLLALRNRPADEAQKTWEQLLEKTKRACKKILDTNQLGRLKQIMLRVRGIKLVLSPNIAERLELSNDQKSAIQNAVDEAAAKLEDLQKQLPKDRLSRGIASQARQVREREQKQILRQLTGRQRQTLARLLGRRFDPNKLGRVSFKAPELVESGVWINSRPLQPENVTIAKREEAGRRRPACERFWRARWKKAIPALIEAFDDPYEETDFVSVGAGHAPERQDVETFGSIS